MRFGTIGLALVLGIVVSPIHGETEWELTHRLDDDDPDYVVYTVSRLDDTESIRISIERTESGGYNSDHFARVVVAFCKRIGGLLEEERGRAHVEVQWSVDGDSSGVADAWWNSGKASFTIDREGFKTWRRASTLSLYVSSPSRRLEASFAMKGLGRAFSRVEYGVPANNWDYPLAGVNGVTYPVLIESTKVNPYYPERARNQKLSGQVILQVVVKADGTVGEMRVIRCDRPALGFERATKHVVRQWRYEPATRNGKPLDVLFTVVVDYSLH